MLQVLLLVYLCTKIYYLHKPLTGDPKKDNNIQKYRASRNNKSSANRLLSLILICLFSLGTFVSGFYFILRYKDDGGFAFYGKAISLNECVKNGDLPEEHTYVTVTFNMVGETFDPIHSGTGCIYYPVVLDQMGSDTDRPNVFAIYIDEDDTQELQQYSYESKNLIGGGKSDSFLPRLEYTGRLVAFNDEMEEVYRESLSDIKVKDEDYIIRPFVVNCNIEQKEIRDDLIQILVFCHTFFTFAFMLILNELIDEGKLD